MVVDEYVRSAKPVIDGTCMPIDVVLGSLPPG
jgi:hypothetical protein